LPNFAKPLNEETSKRKANIHRKSAGNRMHTFTQDGESCEALFTKVRQTAEEQKFYQAAAGEDEKIAADVYRPIISIYGPRPVSTWTKP
jgi:hypothetical protein